ncbi:BspA family leucine-rich repeat surface protein [Algibacter sp. L1A34]|uniref:BspA family leucine-rich repeat surface protein n=1 Tax=Algibacter sp. L1A34 TaxID=2686365 RepID=UPI00131E6157|nr:BspA family leucine-rich repeat surface protein [Algibacter sp. L1A34]
MNFKKYTITILSVLLLISCSKDDDNGNKNQGFVTTWQTTASNEDITIYTNSSYTYNYTVDWGDGTISNNAIGTVSHTYATAGAHTVSITGDFPAIYNYESPNNAAKLQTIESWGNIAWKSMYYAFSGCVNLRLNTKDAPNLSSVTSLRGVFRGASSFNQDLSGWDVSNVIDMNDMFRNSSSFNQDLSDWATGNVRNCYDFSIGSALTISNLPTLGRCF